MSIQASQGLFNNFGSKNQNALDRELASANFNFDDNKKEFDQLKEILKQYQPDKELARLNTIKRRKNKKMEQVKTNMFEPMSLQKLRANKLSSNDEDEREGKLISEKKTQVFEPKPYLSLNQEQQTLRSKDLRSRQQRAKDLLKQGGEARASQREKEEFFDLLLLDSQPKLTAGSKRKSVQIEFKPRFGRENYLKLSAVNADMVKSAQVDGSTRHKKDGSSNEESSQKSISNISKPSASQSNTPNGKLSANIGLSQATSNSYHKHVSQKVQDPNSISVPQEREGQIYLQEGLHNSDYNLSRLSNEERKSAQHSVRKGSDQGHNELQEDRRLQAFGIFSSADSQSSKNQTPQRQDRGTERKDHKIIVRTDQDNTELSYSEHQHQHQLHDCRVERSISSPLPLVVPKKFLSVSGVGDMLMQNAVMSEIVEEEQEELIYFQYNSDGEIYENKDTYFAFGFGQWDDYEGDEGHSQNNQELKKQKTGSCFALEKTLSLKKIRSSNNVTMYVENNGSSSQIVGGKSNIEYPQKREDQLMTDRGNTSILNNSRLDHQKTAHNRSQFDPIMSPSFVKLNKLLQGNSLSTFRFEGNGLVHHHSNIVSGQITPAEVSLSESKILPSKPPLAKPASIHERSTFGRFLTVDTGFGFNKFRTQRDPALASQNNSHPLKDPIYSPLKNRVYRLKPAQSQMNDQQSHSQNQSGSFQLHNLQANDTFSMRSNSQSLSKEDGGAQRGQANKIQRFMGTTESDRNNSDSREERENYRLQDQCSDINVSGNSKKWKQQQSSSANKSVKLTFEGSQTNSPLLIIDEANVLSDRKNQSQFKASLMRQRTTIQVQRLDSEKELSEASAKPEQNRRKSMVSNISVVSLQGESFKPSQKKRNQNLLVLNNNMMSIEEELSEHSSPALYSRRLSMKKDTIISKLQKRTPILTSADQSQYSRNSTDQLDSENDNQTKNGGSPDVMSESNQVIEPRRRYTSFLTLNRYNKVREADFRDEDIDVMKINSKVTHRNQKMEKIALQQVIFVVIGLFLFVIDTETYQHNFQVYDHDFAEYSSSSNLNIYWMCNILRALHSVVCIVQVTLVIRYARYKAKIARIKKIYPTDSSMINRFELPQVLVEVMIFMIHFPPLIDQIPFLQGHVHMVQAVVVIGLQLKFFTFIRLLSYKSPLNTSQGRFVTALRGIDYSTSFLVKVWFTMNPFKGFIFGMSFFILLNSYVLLINERMAYVDVVKCYELGGETHVLEYRDAVWLTIVTFLTVGYGDYYPSTNLGRYIMIVTVMGGQLYSAVVIGLIHGQLMLSSEESGVLNIVSNNRKEKTKRKVAATIIYYLLKMAGVRNKNLQKGNIHWYTQSAVGDIKFELYVWVMKFKKIKSELANYYATRGGDSSLSIIKNTENQLALLASEVIKIFDLMKDHKLERKKNMNDSILMRMSSRAMRMMQQSDSALSGMGGSSSAQLPVELSRKTTSNFLSPNILMRRSPTRVQSDVNMSKITLLRAKTRVTLSSNAGQRKVRSSKTLAPHSMISPTLKAKAWNKKVDQSIVEEDSDLNSSTELDLRRYSKMLPKDISPLTKFHSVNLLSQEGPALFNNQSQTPLISRLEERKRQQMIQHQMSMMSISNHNNSATLKDKSQIANQSRQRGMSNSSHVESFNAMGELGSALSREYSRKKTSKAYNMWNRITSKESLNILNDEQAEPSSSSKPNSNHKKSKEKKIFTFQNVIDNMITNQSGSKSSMNLGSSQSFKEMVSPSLINRRFVSEKSQSAIAMDQEKSDQSSDLYHQLERQAVVNVQTQSNEIESKQEGLVASTDEQKSNTRSLTQSPSLPLYDGTDQSLPRIDSIPSLLRDQTTTSFFLQSVLDHPDVQRIQAQLEQEQSRGAQNQNTKSQFSSIKRLKEEDIKIESQESHQEQFNQQPTAQFNNLHPHIINLDEELLSQLDSNQDKNYDQADANPQLEVSRQERKQAYLKRLRSEEVTPHLAGNRGSQQLTTQQQLQIINQQLKRKSTVVKSPGGLQFKSVHTRKSPGALQKSNTNISMGQLQKKLSMGGNINRLKQQKTQLHPNLNSIIEEEETFSEDYDDEVGESDLEINEEEDEGNSNGQSDEQNDKTQPVQNDRNQQIGLSLIHRESVEEVDQELSIQNFDEQSVSMTSKNQFILRNITNPFSAQTQRERRVDTEVYETDHQLNASVLSKGPISAKEVSSAKIKPDVNSLAPKISPRERGSSFHKADPPLTEFNESKHRQKSQSSSTKVNIISPFSKYSDNSKSKKSHSSANGKREIKLSNASNISGHSSISQCLEEYKRQKEIQTQMNQLNKIYENFKSSSNSKPPLMFNQKLKLDNKNHITFSIEDLQPNSPYEQIASPGFKDDYQRNSFANQSVRSSFYKFSKHSKHKNRNIQQKQTQGPQVEGDGDKSIESFFVSEEMSSSRAPSKQINSSGSQSNNDQGKKENKKIHLIESIKSQGINVESQGTLQNMREISSNPTSTMSLVNIHQKYSMTSPEIQSDIQLSPIIPAGERDKKKRFFQLELKQLPQSQSSSDSLNFQNELLSKLQPQSQEGNFHEELHQQRKISQPQIDLLDIIEKSQQSPTLSLRQKASILSFQEQINSILANHLEQQPLNLLHQDSTQNQMHQSQLGQLSLSSPELQKLLMQKQSTLNLGEGIQPHLSNIALPLFSAVQSKISARESSSSENILIFQSPKKLKQAKEIEQEKEQLKEDIKSEDQKLNSLNDKMQQASDLVQKTLSEARLKILKLKNQSQQPTLQVNIQQLKVHQKSQNQQNTIQMYNIMDNVQVNNTQHTHIYAPGTQPPQGSMNQGASNQQFYNQQTFL